MAAIAMAVTALVLDQGMLRLAMILASGLLGGAWAATVLFALKKAAGRRAVLDLLQRLQEQADDKVFATDGDGRLLYANKVAHDAGDGAHDLMIDVLAGQVLDAETKVADAIEACKTSGRFEEEINLRNSTVKLKAQVVEAGILVWEVQKVQVVSDISASAGNTRLPMLTVGRSGTVLFMNAAARQLLGERKKTLVDIFGAGADDLKDANLVHTATGEQQCLVAEYDTTAGRREVYILPTETQAVRDGEVQFDELPVALLKLEPEGRVILANRAARNLLQQELSAETVMSDLMEGLGRSIRDWLVDAADGKTANLSEFLRLKREDKEVIVQVSLNRVVEGGDAALIAVLSDATELKSLEAQFVQSQKMQAIGQLAGGVAHDFNNLLTAISGHCDLLLLRHDQGDGDYADLIQINQNANRAAALVGQLLAFSRKQNLRPEVLDLRNTLADLTHLLNRLVGERVSLNLNNDPVLPAIRADKRQLEQVLMNLVVNARDAMPEGGEIQIITEGVELSEPLERDRVVVPVGKYVSVAVRDEGVGIAQDKIQKVFEPFFTTKRTGEGTGLGLSTAYGIIKQTGGYIFVDSTEGVGTTFTLMFPAHGAAEAFVAAPETVARPDLPAVEHSGVVLLVEDEAPVRSFAARALKMRGFTVLEAASGEDALELLASEKPRVDVFVSDVIMPGIDGPSWIRQARDVYPEVPVIFVSGYAEDSFSDDQAQIENSSFLPKPFSLGDLTEAVQARVGKA
ncbi:hybrid sensor histidine kinase/response regulator [Shimia marina]|uniref:histidine kinase n=1 Tax=Shimia marina TaxID=321267 RepID=A0A0P1FEX5_9RHOB|nr:ATP-binding protein [Shimia marina]CUH53747.1 Blue-light-activated protein [Shimia marina]SFD69443.1 two-component system, cell cycle sensor histidine kinase and response regulator CckA [Shimia marina]